MLKNRINVSKKEKGLTLIESLVVVGILLGIVAIALTLYGTVRDRLNVKNTSEDISFMYAQITDLFSDEGTSDLKNDLAIAAGIVPNKSKVIGTTVYNSWDGKVTIKGEGENGFEISLEKVPEGNVCIDLVRNQRKVGWDRYEVGSNGTLYSAMKTVDLAKHCKGNSDYVTVTFIKQD